MNLNKLLHRSMMLTKRKYLLQELDNGYISAWRWLYLKSHLWKCCCSFCRPWTSLQTLPYVRAFDTHQAEE
jgi:hypothetical protein